MKIIFLDIDGVLNCEQGYEDGFCIYTQITNPTSTKKTYQSFYPPAKEYLNKLIKETGAKIVVSSTWRISGIKWLQDVWRMEEMEGEIIDITPKLHLHTGYSVVRGQEIRDWLRGKGYWTIDYDKELQRTYSDKSGIENYIIIDDDQDMLYEQRNNFVCVLPSPVNKLGFNEQYYKEALEKLNK